MCQFFPNELCQYMACVTVLSVILLMLRIVQQNAHAKYILTIFHDWGKWPSQDCSTASEYRCSSVCGSCLPGQLDLTATSGDVWVRHFRFDEKLHSWRFKPTHSPPIWHPSTYPNFPSNNIPLSPFHGPWDLSILLLSAYRIASFKDSKS